MDEKQENLQLKLCQLPNTQKEEKFMKKSLFFVTILIGAIIFLILSSSYSSAKMETGKNPKVIKVITKKGVQIGKKCLNKACHGSTSLKMQVGDETVPLNVDIVAYSKTKHGKVECLKCHTGMKPTPPHSVSRTYGSWSLFSVADPDVTKTRNYYVVPGTACLKCHTKKSFKAFSKSDHATDKDRQTLFDGSPRVEVQVQGTDGEMYPVNETYNETECGSCHINNNCATCHWKSKITQQQPGSATSLWMSYDDASAATKTSMTEKSMDWTENIVSHDFLGKAKLTKSNEVCSACHSGFYDDAQSGSVSALGIEGRVIEGHPQVEELLLSAERGVHTTKKFCTDCHKEIHKLFATQTASNGWTGGKTQCINCHADKKLTGTHADVACIGCHDAELDVMRDKTTNMVVPETVDVNLEKSWPSHNLIKGQDIKCIKCHVDGNKVGADTIDHQGGKVHSQQFKLLWLVIKKME